MVNNYTHYESAIHLPPEILSEIVKQWLKLQCSTDTLAADVTYQSPFVSEPARSRLGRALALCTRMSNMRQVCRTFAHDINAHGAVYTIERISGVDLEEQAMHFLTMGKGQFTQTLQIDAEGQEDMPNSCVNALYNALTSCRTLQRFGLRVGSTTAGTKLMKALDLLTSTNNSIYEIAWDRADFDVLSVIHGSSQSLRRISMGFHTLSLQFPIPSRSWPNLHTLRICCRDAGTSNMLLAFQHDSFMHVQCIEYYALYCGPGLRRLITRCADTLRTVVAAYRYPLRHNSLPPLPNLCEIGLHVMTAMFNLQNVQPSTHSLYIYGIEVECETTGEGRPIWVENFKDIFDRLLSRDVLPELRYVTVLDFRRKYFIRIMKSTMDRTWWRVVESTCAARNIHIVFRSI